MKTLPRMIVALDGSLREAGRYELAPAREGVRLGLKERDYDELISIGPLSAVYSSGCGGAVQWRAQAVRGRVALVSLIHTAPESLTSRLFGQIVGRIERLAWHST